uniref:Uncharacterized protein n=1 Tax=Chromera velia CCMP2878 TaxID=1169474 RepID=A0A0G4FG47_9ALVE|eukprot:Cvel_16835.t1-p1 / transcript=Cvel_16835.t1 / gene=Cvel_16835 / organism=Chromera_velia_CCMP2878 / gene_product=hypothetical protein / transcript_product=hypothetical protein / location=Cvel_scaffold1316:14069-16987(-) / protein_length=569 / sequence_SO=supercontig / SO=protein_coding / is_pseudo=false
MRSSALLASLSLAVASCATGEFADLLKVCAIDSSRDGSAEWNRDLLDESIAFDGAALTFWSSASWQDSWSRGVTGVAPQNIDTPLIWASSPPLKLSLRNCRGENQGELSMAWSFAHFCEGSDCSVQYARLQPQHVHWLPGVSLKVSVRSLGVLKASENGESGLALEISASSPTAPSLAFSCVSLLSGRGNARFLSCDSVATDGALLTQKNEGAATLTPASVASLLPSDSPRPSTALLDRLVAGGSADVCTLEQLEGEEKERGGRELTEDGESGAPVASIPAVAEPKTQGSGVAIGGGDAKTAGGTISDATKAAVTKIIAEITAQEIVAAGKKVWDVVQKSRPVVRDEVNFMKVLPVAANGDASKLYGWRSAESGPFHLTIKNCIGVPLATLDWVFSWKYNGRFDKQGKQEAVADTTEQPETVRPPSKETATTNGTTPSQPQTQTQTEGTAQNGTAMAAIDRPDRLRMLTDQTETEADALYIDKAGVHMTEVWAGYFQVVNATVRSLGPSNHGTAERAVWGTDLELRISHGNTFCRREFFCVASLLADGTSRLVSCDKHIQQGSMHVVTS